MPIMSSKTQGDSNDSPERRTAEDWILLWETLKHDEYIQCVIDKLTADSVEQDDHTCDILEEKMDTDVLLCRIDLFKQMVSVYPQLIRLVDDISAVESTVIKAESHLVEFQQALDVVMNKIQNFQDTAYSLESSQNQRIHLGTLLSTYIDQTLVTPELKNNICNANLDRKYVDFIHLLENKLEKGRQPGLLEYPSASESLRELELLQKKVIERIKSHFLNLFRHIKRSYRRCSCIQHHMLINDVHLFHVLRSRYPAVKEYLRKTYAGIVSEAYSALFRTFCHDLARLAQTSPSYHPSYVGQSRYENSLLSLKTSAQKVVKQIMMFGSPVVYPTCDSKDHSKDVLSLGTRDGILHDSFSFSTIAHLFWDPVDPWTLEHSPPSTNTDNGCVTPATTGSWTEKPLYSPASLLPLEKEPEISITRIQEGHSEKEPCETTTNSGVTPNRISSSGTVSGFAKTEDVSCPCGPQLTLTKLHYPEYLFLCHQMSLLHVMRHEKTFIQQMFCEFSDNARSEVKDPTTTPPPQQSPVRYFSVKNGNVFSLATVDVENANDAVTCHEMLNYIFKGPRQELFQFVQSSLDTNYDSIGLFLMIIINEKNRTQVKQLAPGSQEGYFDDLQVLLWSRLRFVMEGHIQSLSSLTFPNRLESDIDSIGAHASTVFQKYTELSCALRVLDIHTTNAGLRCVHGIQAQLGVLDQKMDIVMKSLNSTMSADEEPNAHITRLIAFYINNLAYFLDVYRRHCVECEQRENFEHLKARYVDHYVDVHLRLRFPSFFDFLMEERKRNPQGENGSDYDDFSGSRSDTPLDVTCRFSKSALCVMRLETMATYFCDHWETAMQDIQRDVVHEIVGGVEASKLFTQIFTELLLGYAQLLKFVHRSFPSHLERQTIPWIKRMKTLDEVASKLRMYSESSN